MIATKEERKGPRAEREQEIAERAMENRKCVLARLSVVQIV